MVLITLGAAALCWATSSRPSADLIFGVEATILALVFNACGHCILSWRQETIVPGTVSAVLLVLPYGGASTAVIIGSPIGLRVGLPGGLPVGGDSAVRLLLLLGPGVVLGPAATALTLGISYAGLRWLSGSASAVHVKS